MSAERALPVAPETKDHPSEGPGTAAQRLEALRSGEAGGLDLGGLSLIGEDLRKLDLSGVRLAGADLSQADLRGARLPRCDLRGATLFQAKLEGCELLGADLREANLRECSARRAGFGHAKLSGSDLFQADLAGATLSSADLRGADLRAANLEGARLREADLRGVDFTRTRLRRADLGKSNVAGAHFENADLRETRLRALVDFERASWIGADIRDVDFTGAYLLRRFIRDENYLFEFRTRNRTARMLYILWWLSSDCGRSLLRWFLWIVIVAVVFGALYLVVDIDYGAHRTPFSAFYFSFVTLTTLGYGDVVPASTMAQAIATLEVLLGYVGLGGLLSILANKMARRAD